VKIAHVITNLHAGGAQVMLRRLVERLDRLGHRNHVVSLAAVEGAVTDATTGTSVESMGMAAGEWPVAAVRRLSRSLSAWHPDIVQTWLYHADLVGGLAARIGRVAPVVWGLHHVVQAGEPLKVSTRAVIRVNAWLSSRVPARIICCAYAAKAAHERLGYAVDKLVVIPNGFDTGRFRPDAAARAAVRTELGLSPGTDVVTMVARFHPHKDHRTFLAAAAKVVATKPATRFVLAGESVEWSNATLRQWIEDAGIATHVHLLGRRDDIARLMAGSDIVSVVSTSTEAMPLVIGEAMACGTPCVASDVGDCAHLIGDTGGVVPPRDAAALARAWTSLLEQSAAQRAALGARARARVCEGYDLDVCAARYVAVYEDARRQVRREPRLA